MIVIDHKQRLRLNRKCEGFYHIRIVFHQIIRFITRQIFDGISCWGTYYVTVSLRRVCRGSKGKVRQGEREERNGEGLWDMDRRVRRWRKRWTSIFMVFPYDALNRAHVNCVWIEMIHLPTKLMTINRTSIQRSYFPDEWKWGFSM